VRHGEAEVHPLDVAENNIEHLQQKTIHTKKKKKN
jgi:hypothetical protein